VRIILLFLSSPSNFVPVRFVSLKNVRLTVQVCYLFYFLLHSTVRFSKEKKRVGILVSFVLAFLKIPGWYFWLCPITSNLKIIMDL